jgi:N-acetylglutamate synthase-like GNAT family acetyltransferase
MKSLLKVAVRPAIKSDAKAACKMVRTSFQDLCLYDHKNDKPTLEQWLEDKTIENFERKIGDEKKYCFAALCDEQICGFSQLNLLGEVVLLYVDAKYRFSGVSTNLLKTMEKQAIRLGVYKMFLNSSQTAKYFYASRGYKPSGKPIPGYGVTVMFPLDKELITQTHAG